ncbi:sensor histidine kinase [Paenibacillus hamazuiensis]|uniref:sensor histidine kinase n=1 Tax=Paenibacillus hamazuiensis TaxID=2936508 RepID=UPI002010AC57|nr:sensor histidine kinase [Paenibacillus hamazuiensis]
MYRRWLRLFSIKSFRTKLTLVSVICIMLPALATLTVYNYLTRDAVKDQAVSNAQETLKLVDGHVTNVLQYMTYLLNYFEFDTGISMALQQLNATAYDKERMTNEQFITGREVYYKIDGLTFAGEKSYLTIILRNGLYFTNYPTHDFAPESLLKEPWLENAKNVYGYNSYWVGTLPTAFASERLSNNPYQLTVVRPLRLPDMTIYGYVVVTIMESQIHRYFQELPSGLEVMLLDGNNRILSHTDPARIGQGFPYLKQAEANHDTNIVRIDGTDYLISRRDLVFNGWRLVSLIPYRTAVSKINSIFENVFLLQLVSFALFFILLMIALRAFTKPLLKLDKVAGLVQKGDLSVRSYIRGHDEIGRLGKSFDLMLDRISAMIDEITLTQVRKRKAELKMLQAQINPHFLFNVLNSIRMKVFGRGDRESAEMISSLSKLLRMTIQDDGYISLHEEVETAIDYMKLMNMRQKQKVQLEVDIATDVFLERVPRLFLQPMIENALIHGLSQRAGTIRLQATADQECVRIEVEDDGQGMDEAQLARIRSRLTLSAEEAGEPERKGFSSIGLANVYERMRMTFGDAFRMEIDSEPGRGTCVTMYIPKHKEESEHV